CHRRGGGRPDSRRTVPGAVLPGAEAAGRLRRRLSAEGHLAMALVTVLPGQLAGDGLAGQGLASHGPGRPPLRRVESDPRKSSVKGDADRAGTSRGLPERGNISPRTRRAMSSDPVAGTRAYPAGQEHPARLDVGVIGAGRVGTALAVALRRAGHRIAAASAVSSASRERVARYLPGTPVLQPADVIAAADLALLTVPDDALAGLVRGL